MASKTVTQFTDDLDGSTEGVETVRFGLHGTTYEVDLTQQNQEKLQAALEPFLDVARKAGSSTPRRASSSRSTGSGAGYEARAVRVWAAENGIEVPPRGRIPGSVIEQYRAAGH